MPLYEYQCDACGHRFEMIQKFSDPPLDTCPKCGGAVRKLISSPAFQFKGSGLYITDYAKKDQGRTDKTETSRRRVGREGDDQRQQRGQGGERREGREAGGQSEKSASTPSRPRPRQARSDSKSSSSTPKTGT